MDGWRRDVLSNVTSPWIWIALGLAYVLALGLATRLADSLIGPAIAFDATVVCWFAWWRLRKRDLQRRWLAALTPVTDLSTLSGEVTILGAALDAMAATLSNPNAQVQTRLQAIRQVVTAGAPLMDRGAVTVETATVSGYPAWPEVDRTEMPGQDGDYVSLHMMRLRATMTNMTKIISDRLVFEETVSRTAGEIIPPLRAIEAEIAKAGR